MNIDFSFQKRRRDRCCAAGGLRIEVLEKRELLTTAYLPSQFGSSPGEWNALTYRGSFESGGSADSYVVDLRAGDVFNVTADQINGASPTALVLTDYANRTLIHTNAPIPALPDESPLSAGQDVGLAYVITGAGRYKIEAATAEQGDHGNYSITFQVFRPALEQQGAGTRQVLYLDFDGASLNPFATFKDGTNKTVDVSPFGSYLEGFGLVGRNASQSERERIEDLVIDKIVANVTESLYTDILRVGENRPTSAGSPNGAFGLSIVDSRNGMDLWGTSHVTRVIVGGGNSETGMIGDIAESVDVGNMVTEETAIVQVESKTHLVNGPLSLAINPNLSEAEGKMDFIAEYIGNIIAHEAGHLFGLYHTDADNGRHVLMDRALTDFMGEDQVFGTRDDIEVDFGFDHFLVSESEFFSTFISGGRVNNADWLSFSLSTGKVNFGDVNGDGSVDAKDLNVLGTNWDKQVSPDTRGDLNGDGVVNAIDLNQIGLGWQRPF